MRVSTLAPLALLPALGAAAGTSGSISSASSSVSSAASSGASSASSASTAFSDRLSALWDVVTPYLPTKAPSLQAPAVAALAAPPVSNLTSENFASTLGGVPPSALSSFTSSSANSASATVPSPGSKYSWLVLVTGGNVTCVGQCAQLDAAWELASVQLRGGQAPKLARLDCEAEKRLCATVGATPGSLWWVEPEVVLVGGGAKVETEGKVVKLEDGKSRAVWVVPVNTTTVGADEIARLYRKGEWKAKGALYETESLLSRQPFDGRLARRGVLEYAGWGFFVASVVPGWTLAMMASVTVRLFMQRRALPKESAAQKAERERKEKYTADGKVRGAPPGDGTSAGPL